MAKFYGAIGYAIPSQTSPGVWQDEIVEKVYRGDIVLDQRRWQKSEGVNDNLNLDNSVSIIADAFAYENAGVIKYIVIDGAKWCIQSVRADRPRLVLQIGGLYNGR